MMRMICRDVSLPLAQAACTIALAAGAWLARIMVPGALILFGGIFVELPHVFSSGFGFTIIPWILFIFMTVLGACFFGTRSLLRLLRMFQAWKRRALSRKEKQLLCLCLTTALLTSGLILTGHLLLDEWLSNNPWLYALAVAADIQYALDLHYYTKLLYRGDSDDPC